MADLVSSQDTARRYSGNKLEIPRLTIEALHAWGKIYIQGMAALEPSPKTDIIKVTSILKVLFPGAKTDSNSLKILLLKYAQVLSDQGHSFYSIDKGIDQCLLRHKSDFMPTIETLNSYISPIQFKLYKEMAVLKIVLERNADHLARVASQKQIGQGEP